MSDHDNKGELCSELETNSNVFCFYCGHSLADTRHTVCCTLARSYPTSSPIVRHPIFESPTFVEVLHRLHKSSSVDDDPDPA
jgi:hypothetical protein